MNSSTYWLIAVSTLCNIVAQLLLKKVISSAPAVHALAAGPAPFVLRIALEPTTWVALTLQILGYIVWFFVLSRGQVAIVFAISGSLFYLLMAGSAWLLLGERLALQQWAGVALISFGVLLMTHRNQAI